MKLFTIVLIGLLNVISLQAQSFKNGTWVDLTHPFSEETLYWPTAKTFKLEKVFKGHTHSGFYYCAFNFSGAEHGGTHIDAPIHFFENRQTVDEIPVHKLIGPGVLINVSKAVEKNRNYLITLEDIKTWEKKHGKIEDDAIVLFNTGMAKFWPDAKKYMGTDKRGEEGVAELQFPGIHPDAAKFLATKRKVGAVGIDAPSIDYGASKLYKSHQILFEKNIPGLENVANLDALPAKNFTIFALPMKIKGGSGGPLRIVAFIPNP